MFIVRMILEPSMARTEALLETKIIELAEPCGCIIGDSRREEFSSTPVAQSLVLTSLVGMLRLYGTVMLSRVRLEIGSVVVVDIVAL